MEKLEHKLWLVQIVNQLFGPMVASLLTAMGFHVEPGHDVIPNYLVMTVVILLLATGVCLFLRARLSVENPGKLQIVMEDMLSAVMGILRDYIGPTGPKYLPLVGSVGLYIFLANMIGKIPGFMSPTASLNVTVGCAITVWVYYHAMGIKAQGLGSYIKHFVLPPGVPWAIGFFIMFPIEIISHLSRVMSLSLRLFGNVFGEELVVLIMGSIIPFLVPLPMMILGVVTGTLQAFIFMLLTVIYLAGAVAVEHHDDAHGEAHGH